MTPIRPDSEYDAAISGISELLKQARRNSARAVNTIMTDEQTEPFAFQGLTAVISKNPR